MSARKRKAQSDDESLGDEDSLDLSDSEEEGAPKKKKAASTTKKTATTPGSTKSRPAPIKKEPAQKVEAQVVSHGAASDLLQTSAPVTTEAAAKKLILQYLKVQNRPYSAIQIHDNLHGRIPKAVLERSLVGSFFITCHHSIILTSSPA